jgi:hypothetical protein
VEVHEAVRRIDRADREDGEIGMELAEEGQGLGADDGREVGMDLAARDVDAVAAAADKGPGDLDRVGEETC